jgi:hypothetical protein
MQFPSMWVVFNNRYGLTCFVRSNFEHFSSDARFAQLTLLLYSLDIMEMLRNGLRCEAYEVGKMRTKFYYKKPEEKRVNASRQYLQE